MKISSTHWAVLAGSIAGGLIGWAIVDNRRTNDVLTKLMAETSKLRLPDPSYAMYLPQTAGDFARLDALACECRSVSPDAADPHEAMRLCMATKLYPDFPWPPMSGDHPSTAELWQDLRVVATRQLALGACPP